MNVKLQAIIDAVPKEDPSAKINALCGLTLLSKYLDCPTPQLFQDLRAVFDSEPAPGI